jgi:hypothetical protein
LSSCLLRVANVGHGDWSRELPRFDGDEKGQVRGSQGLVSSLNKRDSGGVFNLIASNIPDNTEASEMRDMIVL